MNVKLEKTAKFLCRTLNVLPPSLISLDTSKLLIAYFSITGLDIINSLDKLPVDRSIIIDWIYRNHIHKYIYNIDSGICGFRGSSTLLTDINANTQNHDYDCSHLTMTLSGLNCLLTLGDDFSRVDRKAIANSLNVLQLDDGSFTATFDGSENDVRFLYSAASVSFIINDWSGVNKESACKFLKSCLTYEGAFGQNPDAEAHGGSTFCAIAALNLMDKLDILSEKEIETLKAWLVNRQTNGFNGRANKPSDSCYSFWIGSSLKLLNSLEYTNYTENRNYIFETNNETIGGFAKWPSCHPDPLHTFLGLSALSLINFDDLKSIHPALVITQDSYNHLMNLHKKWSNSC